VYDEATTTEKGNDFGLDDICFQNYSELHKFVDDTYEYTIHVTPCAEPCQDFVYRKWNDVLFADNSENEYVGYQWYADSVAIEGATQQFYQLTDLTTPHQYYVAATMTNGRVRTSCAQRFEQFEASASHPAHTPQRVLHQGHLYIQTEDAVYDILGYKVERPLR